MFVRVIRDGTSALYECDHVRMRNGDDPDQGIDPGYVILTMGAWGAEVK